jgi:hypothetical protein
MNSGTRHGGGSSRNVVSPIRSTPGCRVHDKASGPSLLPPLQANM